MVIGAINVLSSLIAIITSNNGGPNTLSQYGLIMFPSSSAKMHKDVYAVMYMCLDAGAFLVVKHHHTICL